MTDSRWRAQARPIIARVLAETRGQDERAIRKALRDAWPDAWGPRALHPYKIWLDEIARQRGTGKHAPGKRRARNDDASHLRWLRGCETVHEAQQRRIREIEEANRAAEIPSETREGER